ncbi:Crp/Fnr family transcriptional regulator [Paracraurococcus lichenis]|uniref:Crp/Fnr family transcriptional regulator n=1 Tax=Paracraurococcus lichenis TaxID=3064888 RepID=A0ABT9DW65_9PROT|nr:Crp/Fnr family transcriptional regulator [Paracraurococcus sp. LOR1-02]MDO9708133.1 Crp/Fnr family transcriptional regulator [Paracraurococcus sp. LOR1-02]
MALAEQHREAVLAGHPLLRHLQRDDLKRLAATARLTRHPRNAVIFQKGDPGSSMMAVIRGRVKICTVSPEGREVLLNIIDHGGVFGEIAILDGRPRTADAVALEETDLLVLERNQFLPFLAGNPEALSRLLAALCQKLRQTSAHLEDALLREAPSRLASGLLRLADTFGRPGPEGLKLNIKLSQQQIGNLIGASRESVNKALNDWARAGHLVLEGGYIIIRNRAMLEEIAAAEA